jgi:D-alanyl-D-alanine carboxypeptidase/D-alanyl-D-alanine-endopeptidase (penicillin-binding protein 4)
MSNSKYSSCAGLYSSPFAYCILLAVLASCSVQKQLGKSATETVLNAPALQTAHVGISIFEPATNRYWYNYQGDHYFVPASNTKLPTCYAAMKYLGDSLIGLMYSAAEEPGKLYIRPTGDPSLLHPDFRIQPTLEFLKQQNRTVVIVNPRFYASSLGSGWAWNDYNENYMAERSAMPLYGNTAHWERDVTTGSPYSLQVKPRLFRDSLAVMEPSSLEPSPLDLGKWDPSNFDVIRDKDNNRYRMIKSKTRFRSADIPFETGHLQTLANLLSDTLHLEVQLAPQKSISSMSVIKSRPTDSLLRPMMHNSDNFFAEQSLLMVSNTRLGYMYDAAIIDTLLKTDLKDLPQRPRWVDGSGLSRYNLFSPEDFVTILNKMKNEFGMERIKVILPTGGEGTISSYYKADSGYIFVKTGTLSGVVALSGFLYTKKNKLLIFSILVNNHNASATDVRRAVEKFLQGIRAKY